MVEDGKGAMPSPQSPVYRRPPITEAVIQIHFTSKASMVELDRFRRRSLKTFPKSENISELQIVVTEPPARPATSSRLVGHKLTNSHGDAVLQMWPDTFAVSRLPPYPGWEKLLDSARGALKMRSAIVGSVPVNRVSTRFINRLDVQIRAGVELRYDNYVKVNIAKLPFDHGEAVRSSVHTVILLEEGKYALTLKCETVPSPLIDHGSIVVDIDVHTRGSLLPHPDVIWESLNRLHEIKNYIFESCITDRARELFA